MIIVSKDGTGDFSTIQDAVSSIPKENTTPVTIFIKSGTYVEKLYIDRPFLTLEGEEVTSTIISFRDYALMLMDDGSKRGTFRTQTVFLDANDFTAKNITFENAAGPGCKVGQALALYADGDRLYFENCFFLGGQDTLFTAPLPPSAMQKNGFIGPKADAPRIMGKHLYRNCFLCGDVDFIFGSAAAFFDHCEIYSNNTEKEHDVKGYITAASTPEGEKYGYVFSECKFTSDCPPNTVYLGRPWRNFAKTVFIRCDLGAHIKEEGWHDWNKKEAQNTVFYAEYQSKGAGANKEKRVSWSHQLTQEEAKEYTLEKVLGNWKPDFMQ